MWKVHRTQFIQYNEHERKQIYVLSRGTRHPTMMLKYYWSDSGLSILTPYQPLLTVLFNYLYFRNNTTAIIRLINLSDYAMHKWRFGLHQRSETCSPRKCSKQGNHNHSFKISRQWHWQYRITTIFCYMLDSEES